MHRLVGVRKAEALHFSFLVLRFLGIFGWFLNTVLAQRRQPTPDEEAAACAACGILGGVFIVIPLLVLALNIALLVWVARDAKARGMDSAVLWMILVMFTSVFGLVIYLFSRPQGSLVRCHHCNNSRLTASAKCPHCGNA